MNYWRLTVRNSLGISEDFDLRADPLLTAGDEGDNHICLQSVQIPSKLKLLRLKRGGPELRLTREIIPSLTGGFEKKRDWKTRLYTGSTFKITDDCSWEIDGIQFHLQQIPTIPLSSDKLATDPLVGKHWKRSIRSSVGFHASIFLVLFVIQALWNWIQPSDDLVVAERISLQEIDEIFNPEPEPVEVVEEEPEPEPVAEAKEPPPPPQQRARQQQPQETPQEATPSAAASGESERQDVRSVGLLAMQATPQSSDERIQIDRARSTRQSSDDAEGVSLDRSSLGVQVQTGRTAVASLGGLSTGAYQSGDVGESLRGSSSANVRLVRREVEIRGGLDASLVQQIIEERLAQVRDCYEAALRNDASLAGKIETAWTIQADGNVANLRTDSADLGLESLHQCIQNRIGRWTFPQPRGGGVVNVKYPFVFSPLGG